MNAWDRQPGEPSLWFDRFERYRLMGSGRTMLGCYHQEQDKNGQERTNNIPGSWRTAIETWRWRERVEAWDTHRANQLRAEDEKLYRDQLKRHRDNALKIGQVSMNNAVRLLAHIDTRLGGLTEAEVKALPLTLIPSYLRAAAAVAESALNGEAQALAVDELLRGLDASQHGDE